MLLSEKQESVQELSGLFENSGASFVLTYQGCTCAELTAFRNEIRSNNARFSVVKNTLARRALQDKGLDALQEHFRGPVAVVWADEDPVGPAKVIKKHAKELDHLEVKAGYVDGEMVEASGVDHLASLPSKEELIAKLLSIMNAPATKLVQMLNAPGTQLARTIDAWRAELEKKG